MDLPPVAPVSTYYEAEGQEWIDFLHEEGKHQEIFRNKIAIYLPADLGKICSTLSCEGGSFLDGL
jgi:hypothetical protein